MITSIFICGTGRCGTTIFTDILSQNPKILNMGETHIFHEYEKFIQILRRRIIKGLVKNKYPQADTLSSEWVSSALFPHLKTFADAVLLQLVGMWKKQIIMDKTPHNLERMEMIIKIYPNPWFIHILRDPRDVYASMKKCSWGFANAEAFSEWYINFMADSLNQWGKIPGKKVIYFEKLISNPEDIFNSLFSPLNNFKYDCSIIDKNKAHSSRYKFDLSPKEIKHIEKLCFPFFNKWKGLSNE